MENFATKLGEIISNVGQANTWSWGLFGDFCEMLMSNPLIAIPVLLSVLSGGIFVAIKVMRKFGLRGRR